MTVKRSLHGGKLAGSHLSMTSYSWCCWCLMFTISIAQISIWIWSNALYKFQRAQLNEVGLKEPCCRLGAQPLNTIHIWPRSSTAPQPDGLHWESILRWITYNIQFCNTWWECLFHRFSILMKPRSAMLMTVTQHCIGSISGLRVQMQR